MLSISLQAAGLAAYPFMKPAVLLDEAKGKTDHLEGVKQPSGQKLISFQEVEKHNKQDDCWVVINVSQDSGLSW